MLVIVDYGMGNLFSIEQACQAVGIECEISSDPERLWQASALILPGVGAFPAAMKALDERGLTPAIKGMAHDRLIIGICLGMQLMMERSEENGGAEGLGFFSGSCSKLDSVRTPNVGWRQVHAIDDEKWDSTPLHGIKPTPFYFSHSFVVNPALIAIRKAVFTVQDSNGEDWYQPAMIGLGNIWGLQFHPEKSGPAGLKVFENIKRMMA